MNDMDYEKAWKRLKTVIKNTRNYAKNVISDGKSESEYRHGVYAGTLTVILDIENKIQDIEEEEKDE